MTSIDRYQEAFFRLSAVGTYTWEDITFTQPPGGGVLSLVIAPRVGAPTTGISWTGRRQLATTNVFLGAATFPPAGVTFPGTIGEVGECTFIMTTTGTNSSYLVNYVNIFDTQKHIYVRKITAQT